MSINARAAVPESVQQLLVIDYEVMQSSLGAMELRNRIMLPELKSFEEALQKSGLNDGHDVEQLAFVLFRPNNSEDRLESAGIAQGQFSMETILANFRKQKLKVTVIRSDQIYPLGETGMVAKTASSAINWAKASSPPRMKYPIA